MMECVEAVLLRTRSSWFSGTEAALSDIKAVVDSCADTCVGIQVNVDWFD